VGPANNRNSERDTYRNTACRRKKRDCFASANFGGWDRFTRPLVGTARRTIAPANKLGGTTRDTCYSKQGVVDVKEKVGTYPPNCGALAKGLQRGRLRVGPAKRKLEDLTLLLVQVSRNYRKKKTDVVSPRGRVFRCFRTGKTCGGKKSRPPRPSDARARELTRLPSKVAQ